MRFWNLIIIASLMLWVTGCASPSAGDPIYAVYFPAIKLLPNEYVEYLQLETSSGRVVAVNRVIADWRADVNWDGSLTMEAGHFSSGLDNVHDLDGIILLELGKPESLKIELHTESTTPTGRGPRVIEFTAKELILKPEPRRFTPVL